MCVYLIIGKSSPGWPLCLPSFLPRFLSLLPLFPFHSSPLLCFSRLAFADSFFLALPCPPYPLISISVDPFVRCLSLAFTLSHSLPYRSPRDEAFDWTVGPCVSAAIMQPIPFVLLCRVIYRCLRNLNKWTTSIMSNYYMNKRRKKTVKCNTVGGFAILAV